MGDSSASSTRRDHRASRYVVFRVPLARRRGRARRRDVPRSSCAALSIGLVISAVAPTHRVGEHDRAAGLVPAGLHALGHGLPARLDPAVPAVRLVRCSPPATWSRSRAACSCAARAGAALAPRCSRSRSTPRSASTLGLAAQPKADVDELATLRLIVWKEFLQLRRDPLLLPSDLHHADPAADPVRLRRRRPTCATCRPRSSTTTTRRCRGSSSQAFSTSGYFVVAARPSERAVAASRSSTAARSRSRFVIDARHAERDPRADGRRRSASSSTARTPRRRRWRAATRPRSSPSSTGDSWGSPRLAGPRPEHRRPGARRVQPVAQGRQRDDSRADRLHPAALDRRVS